MTTGKIVLIVVLVLVACCCFTHRRVIKALIKHEPMPKAPKWHCWVRSCIEAESAWCSNCDERLHSNAEGGITVIAGAVE